ncbi:MULTISPECIES: ABC transporter substrate-binding protein [unclassified Rhizobium]|jgi:NitT/TauT family transport system substrate-binding protein|uniref:ABC transporter substrate-binding protein n=1 Tax=unclassified Rhizobium TaxID=2613769 RepID=UPI000DD85411|nr:ABC transporter substrate-binding protein [Rhizobium sp. UBA1881]
MSIYRRQVLAISVSVVATLASSSVFAEELKTIRIALTPQTYNIPIAEKEGFLAKHGLKVELVPLATGTETIAAVKGGSADIAYADTFAGVNAIHNGFDIKLVAGANHPSPAVNFLVKEDSDIKTIADLKGRTLGLGGVPFFRVFAYKFLNGNGLTAKDVKFSVIKQVSALPEALQNGAVDAIQTLGFQVAYLNDGVGTGYHFRSIIDPDSAKYQNPAALQAGWWTTTEWAAKNEDTAKAFANAYKEFAAWYNGQDEARRVELAKEFDKLDFNELSAGDPQKLKNLAFLTTAKYVAGPVDVAATQEWIDSGVAAAPDQVAAGVSIADHLLPTAK